MNYSEMRQRLEETDRFLEEMRGRDRARAHQKMLRDPDSLTKYERDLIGYDYLPKPKVDDTMIVAAPKPPQPSPRQLAMKALTPKNITWRNSLLARLNAHVVDLAVRHQLTVIRIHDKRERANREKRKIFVSAVTNESTYCAALHEIAHIVEPEADSSQYEFQIIDNLRAAPGAEVAAWRWAVNAAFTWTAPMQEEMYSSLKTYAPIASPNEREEMATLVRWACMRVSGPAWCTFGELDERCEALRG